MLSPTTLRTPRRSTSAGRTRRPLFYLAVGLCALGCAAGCDDDGGASNPNGPSYSDASQSWDATSQATSTTVGGADTSSSTSSTTSSTSNWGDAWGGDANSWSDASADTVGNTNVSLGGSQDFGYFRRLVEDGIVPPPEAVDAAGFFAEHHTELPPPLCGERVCVQAMLGVMGNLIDGSNCTMLQIGLNSPITIDPSQRPPLSLTVVLDVSGSMASEGKIEFVRQGMQRMINELQDDDRIAIVTFSSASELVFPMAPLSGNRNLISDIVDGLRADGGTNIYDGLLDGYIEASTHYDSGRQNRVLLLTDGNGSASNDAILGMSRPYNSDGIGLTTIGLGSSFNFELMRDLALQADGNFYFVEDAGAVDEVFSQEVSYFTVPVAYDVRIDARAGRDYAFGSAVGSPLWEDTVEGGFVEVPSVFLAHRESHDDTTPDGGRRGGGSALLLELMPRQTSDDGSGQTTAEVAVVDLEFREPGTNRIVTDQIVIEYPYAPWTLPTSGHFDNEIVTKSFVMLNLLVGIEQSVLLFHAGQPAEAIATLQRLVAAVSDYEDSANDGMGDVDIAADIELVNDLIAVMESASSEPPVDPEIPDDPWPAD